jgi:hypothetical protein
MSDLEADRWIGPQSIVPERPDVNKLFAEEAAALLAEPLEDEACSSALLKVLRSPEIPIRLGRLTFTASEASQIGDGGFKRVFSIPHSAYVVALPNNTKGYRNVAHWQYVLQEPGTSQELQDQTGILTNPDSFLAKGSLGEIDFPLLVMRGWETFRGVVLDAKNPKHSDRFSFNLPSPDLTIADELAPHLDPAIADIDTLLHKHTTLDRDSLNLIASGNTEALMRVFASEIIEATLERASVGPLEPLDYEYARRGMINCVIGILFQHCVNGSVYFKNARQWERLVQQTAQYYGVTYQ